MSIKLLILSQKTQWIVSSSNQAQKTLSSHLLRQDISTDLSSSTARRTQTRWHMPYRQSSRTTFSRSTMSPSRRTHLGLQHAPMIQLWTCLMLRKHSCAGASSVDTQASWPNASSINKRTSFYLQELITCSWYGMSDRTKSFKSFSHIQSHSQALTYHSIAPWSWHQHTMATWGFGTCIERLALRPWSQRLAVHLQSLQSN